MGAHWDRFIGACEREREGGADGRVDECDMVGEVMLVYKTNRTLIDRENRPYEKT